MTTTINLAKVTDSGSDSVDATGIQLDARSQMLANAAAIVSTVTAMEGKLSETAKQWGHNIMRSVYVDGNDMNALIGDSKVAAGWQTLASSEAGRKAKQRLEVYFSNVRLVAERYSSLSPEQQADILSGLSSIHYLAGQMRKADSDAKKAADKEAKRLKAEADAADAKADANDSATDTGTPEASPLSLVEMAQQLIAAIEAASDDELNDAFDTLGLIEDAVSARINAASEAVAA